MLTAESWFMARHFLLVVKALQAFGLHPVIATRRGRGADLLECAGCTIVDVDFHRGSANPMRVLRNAWTLRRLVSKLDPALVHLIALKPIVTGLPVCTMSRPRPTVVHLTGTGLGGVAAGALPRLRFAAIMRLVARLVSRPNVHLVTENLDDRALLERHGATIGERHTLLWGAGVDPSLFPQTEPPGQAGKVRLGFVGRLVWSKGLDVLIEALAPAREAGADVTLAIFGAVDADNSRSVSSADLEHWGRVPGIAFEGHVEDIHAAWTSCDIAVIPSRGGEGMPRAMLEAAAIGRPLIVTDVPGCRDFVRDGIEGLVVRPEDPQALAEAIVTLARNPDLRRRMGTAARARVLQNSTIEAVSGALKMAYRKTLSIT